MKNVLFFFAAFAAFTIVSCGTGSEDGGGASAKSDDSVLKEKQIAFYEALAKGLEANSLIEMASMVCDDEKEGILRAHAFIGMVTDEDKQFFKNLGELYNSPTNFKTEISGDTAVVSFSESTIAKGESQELLGNSNGFFGAFSGKMIGGNTWVKSSSGWVYCGN